MSTPERSIFIENPPRRLCLNRFELDDEQREVSAKKSTKFWSIRSRRDEPNLLRGDR